RVFLGIAIEHHAIRAGGGGKLARTAPDLHAALATAPFDLLSDLLEDAIRAKKSAVVLAVVRVLGERTEGKAARPPGKVGPKAGGDEGARPGALVKTPRLPGPAGAVRRARRAPPRPGSGHARPERADRENPRRHSGRQPGRGGQAKGLAGRPGHNPVRSGRERAAPCWIRRRTGPDRPRP